MNKRQIKEILTVLNSTTCAMFPYPFGNIELMMKTKELEKKGLIRWNTISWVEVKK